LLLSNGSAS